MDLLEAANDTTNQFDVNKCGQEAMKNIADRSTEN